MKMKSHIIRKLMFAFLIVTIFLNFHLSNPTNISNSTLIHGPLEYTEFKILQDSFTDFKTYIDTYKTRTKDKFLGMRNHTDSLICKGCLYIYNHIHDMLLKITQKRGIWEFLVFICRNLVGLSHPACDGYVNQYGHIMIDSIIDHYLTGEYICTLTHMCKNQHFVYLEGDDYAKDLLKDKPQNLPRLEINTTASTLKVLHITDIHTDLKYNEGGIGTCIDPFCCRNNSIVDPKAKTVGKAGKWGFLGKCDLPLITLMNFLKFVENDVKPDIIVWTGDNPSHDEWEEDTEKEIYEISKLFSNILKEKFSDKGVKVYPAIGNHEKFPSDQFYPFNDVKEKPLLKFFGDLWKPWLEDQSYESFVKYGYYTQKHKDSNLRIISYNCLLCDVFNFYLIKNPTDPNDQVDWLEYTLRKAEKDNEVILLIGHIPSGDTSLLSECAKRYNALTDRFSHIIRAQLAGHTHFDEVKIIKEYFNHEKIAGISFIAPSLTTSTYLNPSFRVFEVDSDTKIFKDYLQYRMNITKANDLLEDQEPEWEISYRATEFFGVTNLTEYDKISQFVENINHDDNLYQKTCRSFFADGSQVEMYCDKQSWRTWNTEDYAFKLFNVLGGEWYKRLPDKNYQDSYKKFGNK